MCFSNSFVTDVIGSKKVGTILKYKAANTTPHIKHRKSFNEDSDLPPIKGTEIREQYPGSFMDFNLIDEETVYVTTLKILNRRAKEKDFIQSFFAKSPMVYKDLKR